MADQTPQTKPTHGFFSNNGNSLVSFDGRIQHNRLCFVCRGGCQKRSTGVNYLGHFNQFFLNYSRILFPSAIFNADWYFVMRANDEIDRHRQARPVFMTDCTVAFSKLGDHRAWQTPCLWGRLAYLLNDWNVMITDTTMNRLISIACSSTPNHYRNLTASKRF